MYFYVHVLFIVKLLQKQWSIVTRVCGKNIVICKNLWSNHLYICPYNKLFSNHCYLYIWFTLTMMTDNTVNTIHVKMHTHNIMTNIKRGTGNLKLASGFDINNYHYSIKH